MSLFFISCEDKAMVTLHAKEFSQKKIPCMRLVVFPPDKIFQASLKELYAFDDNCAFTLEVSKKSGISCNSNQNSDKKALTNFPSSYLKMVVRIDSRLIYSYYIDLLDAVSEQDVVDAFERVQKDLKLNG
ncbi:MAG: hypothetical protein U9Q29_00615 [Campylobacterota bacterium]|nr:hypothetical protein [Campylobacterota bacterium]